MLNINILSKITLNFPVIILNYFPVIIILINFPVIIFLLYPEQIHIHYHNIQYHNSYLLLHLLNFSMLVRSLMFLVQLVG